MTKLEIWNRALALLPHDPKITSETETSKEAKACIDNWDDARNAVTYAHEWGWATESLPVCGHAVPRPDAIRICGLFDRRGRRVKMRLQNGYISAEVPFAVLRYVPDVGDRLDEWPVWFTDAVVAELAYRISGGITGSVQQRNLLKGIAAERLAAAIKIDASETGWSGTDGRTFARARS